MKILKMLGIIAFWGSLFALPSLFVEDVSLAAEQAIRGHDIHAARSGYRYKSRSNGRLYYSYDYRYSTSGHPGYKYNGYRLSSTRGNALHLRATFTGDVIGSQYIDLDDLTLNQALPDPPDVNINLSQSSDSKKALVRWNID